MLRHLCLLAFALAIASVHQQQPATLESRVDALFAGVVRPDGPGCAVGVYMNGETALLRGYGLASVEDRRPITPRTNFDLGSLAKPFTALAVLVLEQQGRLSLDDDVRRWVPELPDYGKPIRVRDLLQHTSGLRDFQSLETLGGRPVFTMTEFLGLMAGQRALNFVPGTLHEYSHSDYNVLGLIVERLVSTPFPEYLRRHVLEPMGMKGSFVDSGSGAPTHDRALGHFVSPQGTSLRFPTPQPFGGGGLYSSVADLAHWDRHFDHPIVGGPAVVARMQGRPRLPNGDTIPYAYGLRLGTYRGLRTVSRGGHPPGMRSDVIRFPEQRFAVATLCNGDHLESLRLAQSVADIYLGAQMAAGRPRPTPPAAIAMSAQELARYAGIYRPTDDPWNLLPIEVRNGVLGEVLGDDSRDEAFYPMTPAGDGRFFEIGSTGNVALLIFKSPAPGVPRRLEISWNDGPVETLERVPDSTIWRPTVAALAEYSGTWFSSDLDAAWRLEVRGQKLVLRRRGKPDVTLMPVARDRFLRGFGPDGELSVRLQFNRDGARKLTHLIVSTPPGEDSVRGLRFVRVAIR